MNVFVVAYFVVATVVFVVGMVVFVAFFAWLALG